MVISHFGLRAGCECAHRRSVPRGPAVAVTLCGSRVSRRASVAQGGSRFPIPVSIIPERPVQVAYRAIGGFALQVIACHPVRLGTLLMLVAAVA